MNFGYDSGRRRSSLSLLQPNTGAWTQAYLNDTLGRLTNVTSPAGTFGTMLYRPKMNPDSGAPDASQLPVAGTTTHWMSLPGGANLTNTFDADGRLLSTTLLDSGRNALNSHSYLYSDAGLRTRQSRLDGSYVNYGYDDAGQLTSASGAEANGPGRLHEQFSYQYDAAGNLSRRVNYALDQSFNANSLNELTSASRSGTYTVAGGAQGSPSSVTVNGSTASLYADKSFAKDGFILNDGTNTFIAVATDSYGRWDTNKVTVNLPATVTFAYDLNGNLRTNGTRLLDYDDENQLIRVTEPGAWKSEFVYDGKMRRRVRKEYVWQAGTWLQAQEVRYVYDGNLVIQERNSMNLPQVTYTRGRDLSGSLEGAGGIGGLLARTDNRLSVLDNPAAHAYYHCDGNGNVTALINVSQLVVARYLYDPFGNTLAATGPLAEANLYRFSSKELHPASMMVYYLYRYYEPSSQRWVNRDPVRERGFNRVVNRNRAARAALVDLYKFNGNNPASKLDAWGLDLLPETSSQACFQNCLAKKRSAPGLGTALAHHCVEVSAAAVGGLGACLAAYAGEGRLPLPDLLCLAFLAIEGYEAIAIIEEAARLQRQANLDYAGCLAGCATTFNDWDGAYEQWEIYGNGSH